MTLAALLGVLSGAALALLVKLQIGSTSRALLWLLTAATLLATSCCVLLWLRHGWTPRFWLLFGAGLVLVDTAAVDWQLKLIDVLLLAVATGAAVACAPWIIAEPAARLSSVTGLAVSGAAFGVAWLAARWLYRGRAEPFGFGDVVLGAFIGALFGIQQLGPALLSGILLAGLAALVLLVARGYRHARGMALPYGTFLCLGALGYLLLV